MTINRYTMGEAKLLYANDKEIVPAHEYDALAAELAGYKESHDKYCPGAARIRELEADLAKYQACRVRDVDEKAWLSKRMSELEAALRGYYEFHTKHDTREGHRKKCSRWSGDLNCSCGGDDLSRAVVLALTPSETEAES